MEERKSSYAYEKAVVILIPKHKIIFVNYGNDKQQFEDFCEDFIEDIGQLSKKYDYVKILGRPRQCIQGLAGTGKTELLLHKIKELYLSKEEYKIVFTCHNKILAENLK